MTETQVRKPNALVRILLCILIIAAGIVTMRVLRSMKQPPREAAQKEPVLKVRTRVMQPRDEQVLIQGFGEARAVDTVALSSEVSGRVVEIHPRLEAGEIVRKGELLLSVDPETYQSALDQAQAARSQRELAVKRLEKQAVLDRKRRETLARNLELAQAEFQRKQDLFLKNRVGTRSGVEQAEQAYNSVRDQLDLLDRQLAVYPLQIRENRSALASAAAAVETARIHLERCWITAPFTGRISRVSVEKGVYTAPGMHVVTLVDDSLLEIRVPLDSRDVKSWLAFEPGAASPGLAWFSKVRPVTVEIRWTEDPKGMVWQGHLHRAVAFDSDTRTVTVAVRITAADAQAHQGFPLVEGMFCRVTIPGKTMADVMVLPRWAVTFENKVYVAQEGRLTTRTVIVAREQNGRAYVTEGILPGDQVIVTRLVDPLENALLEIQPDGEAP